VTEYVSLEYDTLPNLECTRPLYPRLGYLEEFSNRFDGVLWFDFIFHDPVLFVKVKVSLANVVGGSPRRNKHHDFVVPLFTFLVRINLVNLLGIV
jgi:hypothetical protein